jgi:hypothetical protein
MTPTFDREGNKEYLDIHISSFALIDEGTDERNVVLAATWGGYNLRTAMLLSKS